MASKGFHEIGGDRPSSTPDPYGEFDEDIMADVDRILEDAETERRKQRFRDVMQRSDDLSVHITDRQRFGSVVEGYRVDDDWDGVTFGAYLNADGVINCGFVSGHDDESMDGGTLVR